MQAIIGSMQGANPCPHITDKSFQNEVIHIDRVTQAVMFSSDKNDWETPQRLFDELDHHYHFTLDAAASHTNHKVDRYFTADDDGLAQDWGGETVFCNPPYGNKETGIWTKKCFEEAKKPGTTVVLLIPARTDRASFHDYIYNKPGVTIQFLRGRLAFEVDGQPILDRSGVATKAPFPSMIVVFKGT